ncbi:MAG: type II secretion system F family protein [Sporichthyaceae bacterium]|nr:type II secretion system F family protein [Sporichthyaceae bacterium]
MGALIGAMFGLGMLLIWTSRWPRQRRPGHRTLRTRFDEMVAQAGLPGLRPGGLMLSSIAIAGCTALVMLALSRAVPIALAFGVIAGYGPWAAVRSRWRRRQHELRELWPDIVDNLASAVRAGMSLPEALSQLGGRGPAALRPPFRQFGEDYRATGRFGDCLDRLKAALADPTGDRIVESLRLAREVGGSELGRLLRTLSAFLREEVRTRAELESRQTWTINAARLAVAAPWLTLALLSVRPEAVRAYNSASGLVVLACGGGLCVVAYRLMLRIARLPREERVLR